MKMCPYKDGIGMGAHRCLQKISRKDTYTKGETYVLADVFSGALSVNTSYYSEDIQICYPHFW